MIIASWNVNSITVRLPHVLSFLETVAPDFLCLQELKCVDQKVPSLEFAKLGYSTLSNGEKTYNGVAILYKTGKTDKTDRTANALFRDQEVQLRSKLLPGSPEPLQARLIEASWGDYSLLNLYVPNGSAVDSPKYVYKLAWFEALLKYISDTHKPADKLIVVGDFNIAPEDIDVHDPDIWQGEVLVSGPEREMFKRLAAFPLLDSFRLLEKEGGHYSWWDYRMMAFRRNNGLRIDHILITKPLQDSLKRSWIDSAWRKLEQPSDHAPVLIELAD